MAVKVVREFRAWTECPGCDHIAVHWVREARRSQIQKVMNDRDSYENLDAYLLALRIARNADTPLLGWGLLYEFDSECVRTCVKCEHQWTEGER